MWLARGHELRRLLAGTGSYANSNEELTPVRVEWMSVVPLVLTALILLNRPRWARALSRRCGAQVLNARRVQRIEREVVA